MGSWFQEFVFKRSSPCVLLGTSLCLSNLLYLLLLLPQVIRASHSLAPQCAERVMSSMFSILPWQGTVWCPEEPFPMRIDAELSLWGIPSELASSLFMVLGFRWTWIWISNQSGINSDILRTLGSLLHLSIICLPSDGNTWLRGLFWSVPILRYLIPLLLPCSWLVHWDMPDCLRVAHFFFFNIYVFIWLHWLLVVACGILFFFFLFVFLSYSMWDLYLCHVNS